MIRRRSMRSATTPPKSEKTSIGPVDNRFRMTDLLVFAFENKKKLLAPLGD